VPFQAAFNTRGVSVELEREGARAYNRWLAEFCSHNPERHAGCAVVHVSDVGEAVADVDWACRHGLRAAFLDPMADGGPHYNHPCYEPLWRACAERAMPVVFHSSPLTPFDYGPYPGSTAIFSYETTWFAHRPFWFICFGGVLERYPDLKVVFAEQGDTWAPAMLVELDMRARAGVLGRATVRHMKLKPSEYWYRQSP
jgi:predicted TIM-barrel fold metal-dependent hydrolase